MSDPRLQNLVYNVVDDNTVDARKEFDSLMLDKIRAVVDDKRFALTQNLVGGIDLQNDTAENETETETDNDTENVDQEVDQKDDQELEPEEDSNGEEAETDTEESGTDN